jgi:hypothetical protein
MATGPLALAFVTGVMSMLSPRAALAALLQQKKGSR